MHYYYVLSFSILLLVRVAYGFVDLMPVNSSSETSVSQTTLQDAIVQFCEELIKRQVKKHAAAYENTDKGDAFTYRHSFGQIIENDGGKFTPVSPSGCNLWMKLDGIDFIVEFKVDESAEKALAEIELNYKSEFHRAGSDVIVCLGINYQYIQTERDRLICSWLINVYMKNGTLLLTLPRNEFIHSRLLNLRQESVEDHYDMLETVGQGHYGIVYKCREKSTGKIFAAKVIHPNEKIPLGKRDDVRREIRILSQLYHPNIVDLHDSFEDRGKTVLIMEFLSGGALLGYGKMTEPEVIHYVKQICDAVKYMHERNIFHLAIKKGNIMCRTNLCTEIKLIDFGWAVRVDAAVSRVRSSLVDMLGVGSVTRGLLTGYDSVSADLHTTNFSKESKDFITRLMTDDPRTQMSIQEAVNHPWLTSNH